MSIQTTATAAPDEELVYLMALSFLPRIGSVLSRQLIAYCGSAQAVFKKKKHQLERIPGIGPERAAAIVHARVRDAAEAEWFFLQRHDIRVHSFQDSNYPYRLKQCADAPLVVYYKGSESLNTAHVLAIVGTRNITPYGREIVERLIQELKSYGVLLVSGLAYGVDIAAHKSALKIGIPSIGVLAHGLDRIYPAAHRSTAEKMLSCGGLLTEYPSATQPERDNFPARNRIVAGMSDATIVIESADRGGALITAEFANEYNRDVFAYPGRTDDPYSAGCNRLIRTHKALLVESAEQIIESLNWHSSIDTEESKQLQLRILPDLNEAQLALMKILHKSGVIHLDQLSWECQLAVGKTAAMLLELEFMGLVKTEPGKLFRAV